MYVLYFKFFTSDYTWEFKKNIGTYCFSLIFNVKSKTVVKSMLDETLAFIFHHLFPTTSPFVIINNYFAVLLCFDSY